LERRTSAQRNQATTGSAFLPLPPGEIISGTRYRIVTRVGAGAMGAVYQAEHVDLEKRVALKTLLANSARDPKAIERFRQEARAASKIGSPFICDVTDFGELPDGQVFYVMEFIDGPSLRQVLSVDTSLAVHRAIPVLRQVCKALGAAHEKGIIHLDVKPDNIMLTTSGRRGSMVKVVDFGIAGLISADPPPEGTLAEERIVGTIHLPHPAASDELLKFVPPKLKHRNSDYNAYTWGVRHARNADSYQLSGISFLRMANFTSPGRS